ncbi:MAG: diguanylate cyclase [Actinobacteria bacterium 13_2_20CM_2_71_6]|jgi:signal transduction histidine kinase|nr:MAG: diguanylate cyclase [Actinobacteria bacterium 13_2_20CM_2_71_6]
MGSADLAMVRRLSTAVLAVSRHLDAHEVLQTIVATARELLGAEYAALGVPDGAGSFGQFVVDGLTEQRWAEIGPLPRQHGLLGTMLREPHAQRLADIRSDPCFGWWPAAHPELRAFLGMPICDGNQTLGAIYLANKEGGFTDADEELLGVLAAHAAIALTHARLYERSRELTIAEERARLAHDLHDAVAQKLFSLRLTAEAATMLMDRDPQRARAGLAEVTALAGEAAAELHTAVLELRPANLEDDGLATTLRKQVTVLDHAGRASRGPRLTFEEGRVPVLPPAQQEVVLRVAQEALHNALRHAGARTVRVALDGTPEGGARLEVVDDGSGFDPDASLRAGRSLGLRSIRDRARSVRGRVRVTSAPGTGTAVRLEVPGGRAA